MIVLRCVRSLLASITEDDPPETITPNSALGDWYGKEVHVGFHNPQALFVNERTFACVLVPSWEGDISEHFRGAYSTLLRSVELPASVIEKEHRAAAQILFAPTQSKTTLGVLNDAAHCVEAIGHKNPHNPIEDITRWMLDCYITSANDYSRIEDSIRQALS